jgi:hypothetical protein
MRIADSQWLQVVFLVIFIGLKTLQNVVLLYTQLRPEVYHKFIISAQAFFLKYL